MDIQLEKYRLMEWLICLKDESVISKIKNTKIVEVQEKTSVKGDFGEMSCKPPRVYYIRTKEEAEIGFEAVLDLDAHEIETKDYSYEDRDTSEEKTVKLKLLWAK